MSERTNGSHTILEVEHFSVAIICGIHLLQCRISIQHRFSRLNAVILYQSPATRIHSPPLNAHNSAFGLACSCLETSFFLPVWMYSLPSKICAVPNGRTLAGRPRPLPNNMFQPLLRILQFLPFNSFLSHTVMCVLYFYGFISVFQGSRPHSCHWLIISSALLRLQPS